ncbi:hypothetical protein ACWD69_26565 [Micromonospora chokoriensis]
MRLRHSIIAATAVVMLAAGGCGTNTPDTPAAAPPAATAMSAATAPARVPAEPLTAEQVLGKLSATKIGLTSGGVDGPAWHVLSRSSGAVGVQL